MARMAVLLSTDEWEKLEVYRQHLVDASVAVWRMRRTYSERYLKELSLPLNVYFFHRNEIRYRTRCEDAATSNRWGHASIPPPYRDYDDSLYATFLALSDVRLIGSVSIQSFTKWDKPGESYERGQLGLLRVVDPGDRMGAPGRRRPRR